MNKSYRTSISLDRESAEIAERLPNLSAFVREQLFRWAAEKQIGRHVQNPDVRVHGKCNAMHKNLCYVCWPEGRPSRDDWFNFSRSIEFPDWVPIASWEGERSKHFVELARPNDKPKEESRQAPLNNSQGNSTWQRILRRIFSL